VSKALPTQAGLGRSLLAPSEPSVRRPPAFVQKGFRPFFLLASVFASLWVLLWSLALLGHLSVGAYFDPVSWHAHEMIFGFVAAVISGFLLTAVGNWTERETLVRFPLLALAACWTLARVVFLLPNVARWVPAAVDLAYLPLLCAALAVPILKARNFRNLVFIGILVALWSTDLVMHLDVLGVWPGARRPASYVAVDLVVLMIVVFAARVVPMFTRNATGVQTIRSSPRLDVLAGGSLGVLALLDAASIGGALVAVVGTLAAFLVFARSLHWGFRHALRTPLLWILHAAHLWIPLGLALRAVAAISDRVPAPVAAHALTVGAIGAMTLGMMARVSLGHTGRPLTPPRTAVVSFALVLVAACVRVLLPLTGWVPYRSTVLTAGALWSLSFGIFAVAYTRTLLSPRIDGRAG
jgi:uncharacterized protein involved in response to NO